MPPFDESKFESMPEVEINPKMNIGSTQKPGLTWPTDLMSRGGGVDTGAVWRITP